MNLHSIKEGITIPVPVPELGTNYKMYAHIEKVEPASVSRIVEGEVDVEFINEFSTPTTPETEVTHALTPPPTPMLTPDFGPILPSGYITLPATQPLERPLEQRRQQVREAWLKRFQDTSE